jgi:hypothetical protein
MSYEQIGRITFEICSSNEGRQQQLACGTAKATLVVVACREVLAVLPPTATRMRADATLGSKQLARQGPPSFTCDLRASLSRI